jgi:hypothetical protein
VTAVGEAATEQLHEVVLRRFPLRVFGRVREQSDALMRELAILALDASPDDSRIPRRLTDLVQQLGATYHATSEPVEELRDAALQRGEREIDLVYRVPMHALGAVDALEAMLEEADAFCREDGYLLTVASTDEGVALKKWYFEEFRRQLGGHPPTPWPGSFD